MTDDVPEKSPRTKPAVRLATVIRKGWAEARTIIVGALVFVSAFLWRDLIKYGVDALKETRMARVPGWVASLGMATLVTVVTVVIILSFKTDDDKAAPTTRLRQMF